MHRATPANTSFRAYSSGGARSVVDKVNDGTMMQEMAGNFLKGETRDKIESPQNYGFTSVVMPATKGKDGQIEESAEAFISFIGGNRSFPVATIMDDRRHRPMGLKPGENAQYDDIGQMTLMRRGGLYMLSHDGEDGEGKKADRMVSLRHVEKKKQERKKPGQEQASSASTTDTSGPTATQQAAGDTRSSGGQQQQDFKHEGESVNTEIRCTKGRIEFRAGDTVVGYYDKGADTWYFKGKIAQMEFTDKVSIKATNRIETVGKTYLGLDNKDEEGPKVVTEGGPAKQTWAKVG